MKEALLYSKLAARTLLRPLFRYGYWRFERTGRTPRISYSSFRKLHCVTRGAVNREVSEAIARAHPPISSPRRGILGSDPSVIERALDALRTDGFHVFPVRLAADTINELVGFARSTAATLVPGPRDGDVREPFDAVAPRAPRYQFEESELVRLPAVQRLMADDSVLSLAGRYLEAEPINDLVTMWWSAPFGAASSEAAQLFHFDMDRLRFLKLFVYLTDVTSMNGPHVFVRGSHRARPAAFFRDRRFTDVEVSRAFSPDAICELTGPAGTVIAADTSGLHKGKPLVSGSRLMFQLELTNSLFGQRYERHAIFADAPLAASVRAYPRVFQRFEVR